MTPFDTLYVLTSLAGAAFAIVELRLLYRYLRLRRTLAPGTASVVPARTELPTVVVQLPLYNERVHAERVIAAVAAQDYPRDRLWIQVLDDSTDETRRVVEESVALHQAQGVQIEHVRRPNRHGYKAGALAHGLSKTSCEYVAIFDADFCPGPDFLLQLLHKDGPFADPQVAFVQTRWAHENADENMLTRAQSLLIDRHFYVQKPTRQHHGNVTVFNGSAGVLRRAAIDAAGGWQADTVTEDLDLSFRCAFLGLRGIFMPNIAVPSELPSHMSAFKTQQRRWARGTMQCLRKLGREIWSAEVVIKERLDELATISGYLVHPVTLLNIIIWPWAVLYAQRDLFWTLQALMSLTMFVAPVSMALTSIERDGRFHRQALRDTLMSTVIGMGLMVNNTVGLLAGVRAFGGEFERTPKTNVATRREQAYRSALHWTFAIELALCLYMLWSVYLLALEGHWLLVPSPLLWAGCMMVVMWLQLRPQDDAPVAQRSDIRRLDLAG